MLAPFLTGFSIAFSLILAIGAQNAFVLRQGVRGEFVGPIVLFCAASDALLIFMGVYGAGAIINQFPSLKTALIAFGVVFLLFYALTRFYAAFKNENLDQERTKPAKSLRTALVTCAAFTFLNPHVYLDTWVLMGALSMPYSGTSKLAFALGASFSSFVFFTSLGYGARILRPIFQNPKAWKVFDIFIGLLMLGLAWGLAKIL